MLKSNVLYLLPGSILSSWMSPDKLLNSSVPQLFHQHNKKKDSNYLLGLWVHVKCLTQCQTHAKLSIKVSSGHQRYAYFHTDHLVTSMCRVVSCVVEKGCLLWPVCSLGKTLLAFALLYFVLQGQTFLLLRNFLTSYFCIPVPYSEKGIFFRC